ncbi:signal peptidase II [Microbacterium sp. cf046]|uniref:signal peptidase II n=1 Tax=Microbacterium sp. cf046 TaxID=1761803 RepID=UPI0008DFF9D3|nr:signal peptidase II [Microbacterium sp. cf046]SFS03222.1 signal peptidase II [Microbacterium sp. cf046]
MPGRAPLHKAAAGTIVAILAALVLAADQFTKYLALQNLPLEEPVKIFGDFLIFYLVKNPGAAFSLGEGVTWIFTIALTAVAVVIVWLAATRIGSRIWAVVLGLLLGGVLGNLTDRMLRAPGFPVGHVIDFINTPWMMPAIYNVADIFIVTMMISVALLVLVGVHLDGTREKRAEDETLLGEGDEVPLDGGVTGFEGDEFPVANPDAGAPADREPRRDADG